MPRVDESRNGAAQDGEEAARLARARQRRLMICTPVYRDTSWQYTRALVDTCLMLQKAGIFHRAQFVVGNSNLPRARNELVAEFLATDCTDLLFVDSDMSWSWNDVFRLLASEQAVIGGVGRKRIDKPSSDPAVWCARFLPELQQDAMGAIEVAGIGTGFLRIARPVFEAMIDAHPEWKRRGFASMTEAVRAQFYGFFRFGDDEHDTGEDYGFCAAWRALGGSVWIDPEITLEHVGAHSFGGSIAELLLAENKEPA
jgi:hypothetical protein